MSWVVGIDEAGYGPNLGPLVMSAVACRVPAGLEAADFWELLRPAVRRRPDPADDRLLVEDSKLVYSPARGLRDLELSVLAVLGETAEVGEAGLAGYVERVGPGWHADLRLEPWYTGTSLLPLAADPAAVAPAAGRFREAAEVHGLAWGPANCAVVCPARFNRLLDEWGSKGAVLSQTLVSLLQQADALGKEGEPVHFVVDKHGGRNTYAAMLQHAWPAGMVVAHREASGASEYSVLGLGREVRVTVRPRADAEHFGVALASMASKYLRELLMREFNDFWQARVPGLKATAGYPGDSARFFEAIRPAVDGLGLPHAAVWRRR